MASLTEETVLPRPGALSESPSSPIPGPTEEAFTETFGKLLPPATYLHTSDGKAVYYDLVPLSPLSQQDGSSTPERVLFIHGVQTPALGILPLARALQASFPATHFVLVDLWGHGLSDTPVVPHEPSLFHNLLDFLLDRLEWPSAHLVGYSFGGALTVGYVVSRPSRVQSFTLIAPAGIIPSSAFTTEEHAHLRGDDEAAARKWILNFLQGGELLVPADWKERVERGEVVAEAVKAWQKKAHPGHIASVVAIFRDGGVMDQNAAFERAAGSGIPFLVVLGESDDVCTKEELEELGFRNISVVRNVGHEVVRQKVPEVTLLIEDFWAKLRPA
ncbi:hypothetical protein LTR84_009161 [Exophiala bonariae]|uniref:AB hydrolase-1 domain-containing protein n=1 Tax=Exophiala bonariae TaxID=1690606 RepID=A0AAV9MYF9_9EURO|nr:hypothetical protein LTR84_009161 [Exophiala bonariae]